MSTNSVPVCDGCSKIAKVSIGCTKCGHICCLSCFDSISNNNDNDSNDGDYVKLSEWICNGCLAEAKGDEREVHPTEQVSDQKESTNESTVVKESTIAVLCIEENSSVESKPDEPPSGLKEPNVDSHSATKEPLSAPNELATEPIINSEQHSDNDPTVEPPFAQNNAPVERVEPKKERCRLHDKEWKLYCLTCDQLICENCFLIGGSHMRHLIDYVEVIYQERRAKTEQKLDKLGEKLEVLHENAIQSEENLKMVRDAEQTVYDEIELLCTEAKQSVTKLTNERKEKLQRQSDLPAKAQKLNDSLQEMVQQLTPVEFLKHQLEVEKQCDELLGESVPVNFVPERFQDIGCELVPPYEMRTFRLDNFDTTTEWPQEDPIIVCEARWIIQLRKKDSLFVKVTSHLEEAQMYPFKVLVVVPHQELPKTIRKTFNVQETSEEIEICPNEQLETEGFIQQSELVIKIGLRPLNALVENGLMKHQISNTKKRLEELAILTDTKHTDLESYLQAVAVSNQFYIMHVNMTLYKQNNVSYRNSENLTDSAGHQWYLQVWQLDENNSTPKLQVYIVLRAGRSTCQCFVELMHTDMKKNVKQVGKEILFDATDKFTDNFYYGWSCFISREVLLDDPGFYPNGMLRFRFGVLPAAD